MISAQSRSTAIGALFFSANGAGGGGVDLKAKAEARWAQIVKDPKTKEPDAELTAAILTHAEQRGLIILSCGTSANVVRLLAPLTIPDAVLAEGLDMLAAALRDAYGRESNRAVA